MERSGLDMLCGQVKGYVVERRNPRGRLLVDGTRNRWEGEDMPNKRVLKDISEYVNTVCGIPYEPLEWEWEEGKWKKPFGFWWRSRC